MKPIHADVLLRIESTNSESSRGDEFKQQKKQELIEATSSFEILRFENKTEESQERTPRSVNLDSNDEGSWFFIKEWLLPLYI